MSAAVLPELPDDLDSLPPAVPPEKKKNRAHLLMSWSTRKLLAVKDKLEERVRVRALAGLHDAIPHISELARDGGARDAPSAMRELRALALPERRETQIAPSSAGADVVAILDAIPRLLSALPGGRAAAPAILGAVEADYELLDSQSVAKSQPQAGQEEARAAEPRA